MRRLATMVVLLAACARPDAGPVSGAPPAIRYDQHVAAGGAAPPATTLVSPLKADTQSVAEGEGTFSSMNCDGCHGIGATGWVGPSLVDGRWRYGGTDGAIYTSIFYGRPRGMPAYGGALSPAAIWKIVAYLRAQPVPSDVPTESWVSGQR
ncbi:MAG TPA: cytochrome c [Gemmatimonadales bacterium]|nr:cytochrome c [Gemmatimonadales bacterium]